MAPIAPTLDHQARRRPKKPTSAWLTLVLQAEKPLAKSVRHSLDGKTRVSIGRAPGNAAAGELRLVLDDECVSGEHSVMEKHQGRWRVRDLHSKNGTWVDGLEIDEHELRDGAVLEIGHTFFVFRDSDSPAEAESPDPDLRSLNPRYLAAIKDLIKMAFGGTPIILHGESGTGKGETAKAVHRLSGRTGLLQKIDCTNIAEGVAEAELFGIRRGSATGVEAREGLIAASDKGTLFLDEIADLPPKQQARFLTVLQEKKFKPVGSDREISVDFRAIVASHQDLQTMVDDKTFRNDLLRRLNGFVHEIPPLRERREDLGALIASLLRRHQREGADRVRLTLEAARVLFAYDWPANVGELEWALQAALRLAEEDEIDLPHLPAKLTAPRPKDPAVVTFTYSRDPAAREQQLRERLTFHQGNVAAVARESGKARMQIHRWMRECGINPDDFRPKPQK